MSYEVLGHTADEKFRAVGGSLDEAFSEVVKAFGEIVGTDTNAGDTRHEIEVESESYEALLFDFLDKLIYLQDVNDVAVCRAEELEIEEEKPGYLLTATIRTDKIRDGSFLDIKAPTYNEMKVDYEDGEGWVVEAVLDI